MSKVRVAITPKFQNLNAPLVFLNFLDMVGASALIFAV